MNEQKKQQFKKWLDDLVVNPGDEYSEKYEEQRRKINLVNQIVLLVFMGIGLIIYVSISYFYPEYWASLWVLLLAGPIVSSLAVSILHGRMVEFAYPLVCVAFFCSIGFIYNNWHPMWAIFLSIPIYYLIGNYVDRIKRRK